MRVHSLVKRHLAALFLAFVDMLTCALIYALAAIVPIQHKTDGVKPKAEYLIQLSYDVNRDVDIDLWAVTPSPRLARCSFSSDPISPRPAGLPFYFFSRDPSRALAALLAGSPAAGRPRPPRGPLRPPPARLHAEVHQGPPGHELASQEKQGPEGGAGAAEGHGPPRG